MKKFFKIFIISLSLILLNFCAKPTVVNVVLPGDKNLNCKQLEASLQDAQNFRNKAVNTTGNTGKNQARAIFFWPSLMMTYVNAHEAIVAATERSINIINLMVNKKCEKTALLIAEVQTSHRLQTLEDLSKAYKDLNDLYKSGALTENEFRIQKKKILGQ
jgi:hypothetical protein